MPRYRPEELDHIHQAYVTGCELAKSGSWEDAITCFDEVIGKLPRRRRGMVYRIEHPADRPTANQGVHWLPPVFRDALLAKAFCLNELGRVDDAFVLLERAVELDPENPQVYAEIGFVHGSHDDLVRARLAYETAMSLEPDNPMHLSSLAQIALLEEAFAEAQELALRALGLDPTAIGPLHQLAFAAYRLGHPEAAIEALTRAVELHPDDQESVLRLAGTLRENQRIDQAIALLQTYIERQPQDSQVIGMLVELLQLAGQGDAALPLIENLVAHAPHDVIALDLLAWGYYRQNRLEAAEHTMRRLAALEPYQPAHHFKLGILLQADGKLREAMACFQRASALDVGGDMRQTIGEAIAALDQVQISQIFARCATDDTFRRHLALHHELALHQAGYLLSPFGLQYLQAVDQGDFDDPMPQGYQDTVH
jgi:tetratricopeptide (TPR) repeat protein